MADGRLRGPLFRQLRDELEAIRKQLRWRELRFPPRHVSLNFSSNDYLNLAGHPQVVAAAQAAAESYGCGARASRLVTGHTEIHERLETRLARLTGHAAALVLPSGYQANLATIATLAGPGDLLLSDALNHASLIDGCRLSRALVQVYHHGDADHVESLLKRTQKDKHRRIFVITDALFSMDGDAAPLKALSEMCQRHEAALVVDEAHAIGVFGPTGGGMCQALGVRPDVTLGTMSKALGSAGGFVAADPDVIAYLVNRARPFIYSTGLSPLCAAAAEAALEVIAEEPDRGATLLEHAGRFAERLMELGVPALSSASQIIPLLLGDNERALRAGQALEEVGILAVAIRPPTVPEGTARLRLSVTSAHSLPELLSAAEIIVQHTLHACETLE